MKSRLTKFIAPCILLLVILAQAYSYNYLEILQLRPQSTHVWRQTDCTSFALNYYQDGLNPFKPRLHNQFNTNGVTLGEGPILYYAVSVLYAIFGADETVYRGFWLLIWIVGLFHLFKLLRKLLQDDFWAVMITSTVFTVPVIVFYVPNFLPNTPAMAFVFMAWYYFYRYTEDKKKLNLALTVILFSIAGWVKAPALITYFALLGAGSIHQLFVSKQKLKNTKLLIILLVQCSMDKKFTVNRWSYFLKLTTKLWKYQKVIFVVALLVHIIFYKLKLLKSY